MNLIMVGNFYEDEHGSLYEVTDITLNKVSLCRLRDNKTVSVEPYTINTWISNGAMTVYLTSEQLSA